MIRLRCRSLCLLLFLLLPAWSAIAAVPDFVELAASLKPSVVNISTSRQVRFRRPMQPGFRTPQDDLFSQFFERFFQGMPEEMRRQRSLGSGFIISADGYILTNDHVVDGADEIQVRLADGRSFTGTVKGLDPKLDLALIKIDVGGEKLPVARLGSSDGLRVGEWVMAIGNPFGLEQTVTVGIVSAKGRVIGAGPYDDFIQTDASINPGNSGGPLFNLRGEVVGINTAIVAGGQGIGFAIPVDAAKVVLPQLRETGRVVRGWIGVGVQEVTEELARSFGLQEARGALVTDVVADSPAAKAGLQRGDVILAVNGKPLQRLDDLPRQIAALPVGQNARLSVFRGGRAQNLSVTIGSQQEEGEARRPTGPSQVLGLTVGDISPEAVRLYRLTAERGALVTAVEPQGPAAGKLQPGDVVLEIDGRTIANAEAMRTAVGQAKPKQVLRVLAQRREQMFYTTLTVP